MRFLVDNYVPLAAHLLAQANIRTLALLIVGIVTVFIYTVKKIRARFVRRPLPPGPWGVPVIGSAFRIGSSTHIDFTEMANKYGDVFSLYLGSRLVVVLNGSDAIHEALVKNSATFAGRPDLYTMVKSGNGGQSLLNTTYSRKWKLLRKISLSAIHKYISTQDALRTILERGRNRLIRNLEGREGKPHDIMPDLKFATASVILGILFGDNYDTSAVEKVLEISDAFRETVGCGLAVDFMPWLRHFPNKKVDRLFSLVDLANDIIGKMFIDNRATYSAGAIRNLADAFLKVAAETREDPGNEDEEVAALEDVDMIQSLTDLFGAGFDTSSLTLYWAVAYCVKYPKVQEKMQQELDEVVGRDRMPTVEDLKNLPYTNACLYELLRIMALAPVSVPHSTMTDVCFRGFFIPKGTVIFVNLWSVLRNETYWKNPDIFDPTRFLDEEGHLVNPKNWPGFLPFSAGRRTCVGKSLADVELPFYLANLMHHFRFTTDGLLPEHRQINLKGEDGLTLKPPNYDVKVETR